MKRSEMLFIIDEMLNYLMHPRHPSYVSRSKMLLDHLEEKGMLPPSIDYSDSSTPKRHQLNEILNEADIEIGWEPEDDQ